MKSDKLQENAKGRDMKAMRSVLAVAVMTASVAAFGQAQDDPHAGMAGMPGMADDESGNAASDDWAGERGAA